MTDCRPWHLSTLRSRRMPAMRALRAGPRTIRRSPAKYFVCKREHSLELSGWLVEIKIADRSVSMGVEAELKFRVPAPGLRGLAEGRIPGGKAEAREENQQ